MISSQKVLRTLTAHEAHGLFEPTKAQFEHMRRLLLMILEDVSRVCDKHGLRLMLGGGSALGAVRHGGMIPWDDDIDLMLPRADYERFKAIFDAELGEKYALQVPNAPGHEISNLYMKVILRGTRRLEIQKIGAPGEHGLWVDIFPVEDAPDSAIRRRLKGFGLNILAYVAVSNYMRRFTSPAFKRFMSQTFASRLNYRLRMTLGALTGFVDYRRLYNLFDRLARGKRETGWVTVPTGIRHYMGEMHRREEYYPLAEGTFENMPVRLPGDTRAYLTGLYGDYMTPPAHAERERHYYVTLDFGPYAAAPQDTN